ncbi:MAG: hypothetical protein VKJ64_00765, partial [Leptolyngbyaceae bacterium]|nr:hypothetical protein [Leptolyngbyaceae bacterium]
MSHYLVFCEATVSGHDAIAILQMSSSLHRCIYVWNVGKRGIVMTIGAIALLVTVITIAAFTLFGLVKAGQTTTNLEDYMVNRNQVGGGLALATIVASAMGAWILFSPPEAGSAFGGITAILGYCIGSAVAVFLFVFVGPRLRTIMPTGHSLNEYVRYRFGGAMYWLTEGAMVFYMFIYLAAELTA